MLRRVRGVASPLVCAIVVAGALLATAFVDHDVARLGLTLVAFVALLGCNPPNEVVSADQPEVRRARPPHRSVARPTTRTRSSAH